MRKKIILKFFIYCLLNFKENGGINNGFFESRICINY